MSAVAFTHTRFVLAVPSLAVSVPYYRDVLGMRVEMEPPGWCFLERGAFRVMLGECADAIAPRELGDHNWYAYVTVVGVDALFDEWTARGVELLGPLQDKPWGMREFGIRTVDGHRIMVGEERAAAR